MGIGYGRLFGYLGAIFLREVWMQMSETDKTPELHRVQDDYGLTDAEISAFKRALSVSGDPKKGEGCIAKIDDGVMCIRPRSIPHFRKVLSDRGLGDNILIAGIMRHLESDCNRWLRFEI